MAGDDVGMNAARRQHAGGRDADRQDGRLRVLGQRQLVLGPFEAQRRTADPAKRGIGLVERRPRLGERLGQRPAHADLLRTLSGKEKRDHRPGTEAAAISCSTRGMKSLVANRYAIAIALRIAFADDRPWPTIARPATPSSGAPPYSE